MGYILLAKHCGSQHWWELLRPFARSLTSLVMVKIYWLMGSRKFTIFTLSIIHFVIPAPAAPHTAQPNFAWPLFPFFQGCYIKSYLRETEDNVYAFFFLGGGGGGRRWIKGNLKMANMWVKNLDWQEANHLGMIQWRRGDDLRTTKKHKVGIEAFGFYVQVVTPHHKVVTHAAQTAPALLVRFWLTLCQVLSSCKREWQREDPNWTNALRTSFWQIVWAGRVWASRTTRTERAAFISNTSMDLLEPQHKTISAQSSRKRWWVKSLRISWYAMLLHATPDEVAT